MRASIVISSYNYGRFLGAAIDSALAQTHGDTEVIVVDDGSSDDSRDIIESYGEAVVPVLKTNCGQGSALNAGFSTSHGDVVLFMDSDDFLAPTAVESAVALLRDDRVVKAHWPLWITDETGAPTGRVHTPRPSDGDLLESVLGTYPGAYWWPPTTGNAWSRRFLEAVLPMAEAVYRTNPDMYLCALAPLFGTIKTTSEPLGFWRQHGDNASARMPFAEKIRAGARRMDHCIEVFTEHCRRRNIDASPDQWRVRSWWHTLERTIADIEATVAIGETFILVDHGSWATTEVAGRRCVSFPFYGAPADTAAAVNHIERLRGDGVRFMVFVWPRLWWLTQMTGVHEHLRSTGHCVLENDRVAVFALAGRAS